MQITRMFEQGQSIFSTALVEHWLRDRQQDPSDYEILFHERPAPPGSQRVKVIEIELRRKDGLPVDDWLQQEINRCS